MTQDDPMRARVMQALGQVIDPELGLDVVGLGLVYAVELRGGEVTVDLTMTTPSCPLGEHIKLDAEQRLRAVAGVTGVDVRLVWEPPWTADRMSEPTRRALGWDA